MTRIKIKKSINGIKVFIKAPEMEKLFTAKNCSEMSSRWGYNYYELPQGLRHTYYLDNNKTVVIDRYGVDKIITDGGYFNASILRTKGIEKGIEFKLNQNELVEARVLREWSTALANVVREIVKEYIIPIEIKITVGENKKGGKK